jgi:putative protein-disulfide isomerase
MTKTLHYLFDPLCGWCYGASPAMSEVASAAGIQLELAPTGLFSGHGARAMDDSFASYAWSNDQRIERLTGQPFSESYRSQVLADRQQRFDSGPATVALTAVAMTAPQRELEALRAFQRARYVEGRDVTQSDTLIGLLASLGLDASAAMLANPSAALLEATRSRTEHARKLMREFGANGVPAFVLEANGQRRLLRVEALYENSRSLVEHLDNA